MGNLKLALGVAGVLDLIYGLISLSPSLVKTVFEYTTNDDGLLALLAGAFIALGIVTLAAAAQAEKAGGLAGAFAFAQVIGLATLVWQYSAGTFSLRTAIVPAILTVIMAVWIWMARPQT